MSEEFPLIRIEIRTKSETEISRQIHEHPFDRGWEEQLIDAIRDASRSGLLHDGIEIIEIRTDSVSAEDYAERVTVSGPELG